MTQRATKAMTLGVVALLAASAPAPAHPPRPGRSARAQYNYTSGSAGPGGSDGEIVLGKVGFRTRRSERQVRLLITDATGMPVRALMSQDFDGDGEADRSRGFCTTTKGFVPIRGGVDVEVFLLDGPCADGTGAIATSGWVEAGFSHS